MAVKIFNEQGESVQGIRGELVCTQAFPSMPIGFWHDEQQQACRRKVIRLKASFCQKKIQLRLCFKTNLLYYSFLRRFEKLACGRSKNYFIFNFL